MMMDVLTIVISVMIGGVVPAVYVASSVRTRVDMLREDINDLKSEIGKAHQRLDDHILNWHREKGI